MSKLALIRHGESEWNAKGLWTGWNDIGLSEKGKEEARKAGKTLSDITFHHGFTSDLKRAWETLELVKEVLGIKNLPTRRHAEFKERNYGTFAGKNKWEIKEQVGEEKFLAIRRAWNVPIPEGETLKDVHARVVKGYKKHIFPHVKNSKNILFAAHGNSIRALVKHLENVPDDKIAEIEIATGEILLYTLSQAGTVMSKEKRALNKNKGRQ